MLRARWAYQLHGHVAGLLRAPRHVAGSGGSLVDTKVILKFTVP